MSCSSYAVDESVILKLPDAQVEKIINTFTVKLEESDKLFLEQYLYGNLEIDSAVTLRLNEVLNKLNLKYAKDGGTII